MSATRVGFALLLFAVAAPIRVIAQTPAFSLGGEVVGTTGALVGQRFAYEGFGGGLLLEERLLVGAWGLELWQDVQTPIVLPDGATFSPFYIPTELGLKAEFEEGPLRPNIGMVGGAFWHLNGAETPWVERQVWAAGGTAGVDLAFSERFRIGAAVRFQSALNSTEYVAPLNRLLFLSFVISAQVNN